MGMLLLIVSLSIGVFFISALSPLEGLKRQEAEASSRLDGMKTKAIEYLISQKRLGEIESIIKSRPDYPATLLSMTSDGPADITFSGIKIDNKDVTLITKSNSLLVLNSFIQSLLQKSESEKIYNNLVLSSLDYTKEDQLYTSELTVTLH